MCRNVLVGWTWRGTHKEGAFFGFSRAENSIRVPLACYNSHGLYFLCRLSIFIFYTFKPFHFQPQTAISHRNSCLTYNYAHLLAAACIRVNLFQVKRRKYFFIHLNNQYWQKNGWSIVLLVSFNYKPVFVF